MKTLLCILILTACALAQVRTVQPIPITIVTEDSAEGPEDVEYHRLFKAELRKRRDVVLKNENAEYAVCLTATRLVDEKGRKFGYAAATLLITKTRRGDKLRFSIDTGPTLADIARQAVTQLIEQEILHVHPNSFDRHDAERRR